MAKMTLGLIRQSQRGFEMDYHVQLWFDNVRTPSPAKPWGEPVEVNGYGVDPFRVAEGLGYKALRVFTADELPNAFDPAPKLMAEFRVPGSWK